MGAGTGSEGTPAADHGFDLVAARQPALWRSFRDLVDVTWSSDALPPGVTELCRLRIAGLLGASGPLRLRPGVDAPGLEAKIAALPHWPDAAVFDEADRVCLGFAEQFALDAQGIDDAVAGPVVKLLGSRAYATLVVACGLAEAMARTASVLGEDALAVPASTASPTPPR